MISGTDRSPCRQLHALMLASTTEADLAALAAHFESCPTCQEADLDMEPLLAAYREQELAPLAADLEARLLQHLCGAVDLDRTAPPPE